MNRKNILLYLVWLQAIISLVGSLYASEALGWVPCKLCWYQRILMYPLALILPIGIVTRDKNLPYYVLPFSILGMIVAGYQYLLQVGIIPENLAPCVTGISCTTRYINLFGFVSLALLSFVSFAFITICMLISQKINRKS
ncbi:disulfide bond formation protein B [Candidatus Daviesbacteria bacterium]|nr:disulfide bond formation protein B [Candidatus Daviesbacteria bacterium]